MANVLIPEYSLNLFWPIIEDDGPQFMRNITRVAKRWRRSIRWHGGYWQGSFSLVDAPIDELKYWYNNFLGCHIEERSGGQKTWEGMIWEIALNHEGVTRVKSYDQIANHVTTTYVDNASPPAVQISTAATNAPSIARYGRKEELLSRDQYDQATAEALRDIFLKEHAWPINYPLSGGSDIDATASLDVLVCGYAFTINFRYTTTDDDSSDDVDGWLYDIITTDCTDFILPGRIDTNTTSLTRTIDIPERCWDLISEIAPVTASQKLYRAYVANERRFQYIDISLTDPQYLVRNGQILSVFAKGDAINPWTIKPALVRDMDYSIIRSDFTGLFSDARDFIPEEISVSADTGFSWSSLDSTESEQIETFKQFELEQRRVTEQEAGAREKTNWKRRVGLVYGTPEWEEAAHMRKDEWFKKYRNKDQ